MNKLEQNGVPMRKDAYIQAIRGLAIAAVVTIHCLTPSEVVALARPLLNWSVATFLFLSGFLTTSEKVRRGACRRRIKKILVPYLIWTAVYIIVERRFSPWGIAKAVVLGDSATQMYYLVVYAQLVALTPLLYKLLGRCRWVLYGVTPVALLLRAGLAVVHINIPLFYCFFPGWLLFYLVGLDWDFWKAKITLVSSRMAFLVLVLGVFLQMASALFWFNRGDWTMAVTQLKPSVIPSVVACIALAFTASERFRTRLATCIPLIVLGDLSFGIYLCHIVVLKVPRKLFEVLGMTNIAWGFVLSMLVLAASALLVRACQKRFSNKMLRNYGFV